ncbi:T7SS effector LXG polymorphic toxin [Cytobacillus firmus]|uniref:T7SS effector LXG polymorphic toxin n=1 Tax=Cytobacillus firmus TaxID=1399 RepID=A0AA46SMK1_CYTFI|nr:T7SS effector LXG polymorphic toxin [Cytobacillus firmus]UYG98289.1 T7SS effector LXG polymorphic toxin [Cytobacillus firmus]
MKVLDVKDLLLGIQHTSNQLNILKNQIKHVQMAIKEFIVSHEDSFKGDGGRSIINFYQESHLPFLLFFESWIEDYQSYLNSLENTINDFESSPAGFIRQEFLENELQLGLRNTLQITSELTKEANEVIKTVSDIVPLPLLEDNRFIQASMHAQDSSRGTVEKLEAFDHRETAALDPLLKNLDNMEEYIKKMAGMLQSGNLSLAHYQPRALNWEDFHDEISNPSPQREQSLLQDMVEGAIEGASEAVGDTLEGLKSTYELGRKIMGPFSPLFLGSELLFNRDQLLENQRKHQEFYLRILNDPIGKVRQVLDMPKYIWSAITSAWERDVVNGDAKSRTAFFTYGLTSLGIGILGDKGIGKAGTISKTVGQGKGLSFQTHGPTPAMVKGVAQGPVPYNVLHNPLTQIKKMIDEGYVAKPTDKIEKDNYFIGTLKGNKVHLKGVKVEEIIYTKRNPEETAQLRRTFNNSVKKSFLKTFANDPIRVQYLRKAGLDENDIARMKDGLNPKGWQVHHNLPLDDGGTNDFTNLVLIKNDPFHKAVTNEQNSLTRELTPTQSKKINWPIFEDEVYC